VGLVVLTKRWRITQGIALPSSPRRTLWKKSSTSQKSRSTKFAALVGGLAVVETDLPGGGPVKSVAVAANFVQVRRDIGGNKPALIGGTYGLFKLR
jgi:hypothetical protein